MGLEFWWSMYRAAAQLRLLSGSLGTYPGPPVVPCDPFWEEGSPTKIDHRKKLVSLF